LRQPLGVKVAVAERTRQRSPLSCGDAVGERSSNRANMGTTGFLPIGPSVCKADGPAKPAINQRESATGQNLPTSGNDEVL